MRPHFCAAVASGKRLRDPASARAIEPKLDFCLLFPVTTRAHSRAPTVDVVVDELDRAERFRVDVREMGPVERVFVQPLDTHGQHATVAADVPHVGLFSTTVPTCFTS